jgi:hypothetical protein
MTSLLRGAIVLILMSGCDLSTADLDGDGVPDAGDCDPQDPETYPGAEDWFGDGIDQNCDGPDGLDADQDGHASGSLGGDDCDDSNTEIFPGAPEIACDGLDQDCDGVDSEPDLDGDGHSACGDDCDDDDELRAPSLPEICDGADNDCDNVLPDSEQDLDSDGVTGCGGDCGPHDPSVYPGANEACDTVDSDCDGSLADGDTDTDGDDQPDCVDPDDDNDGTSDGDDCAPLNSAIHPAAAEVCNGIDDDCSGAVPSNEVDGDGDGYAPCDGDCDDLDPASFLGVPEVCNGIDDDCDGHVPSAEQDLDGDAFSPCEGDCDDNAGTTHPNAAELCNGIDDDCDAVVPSDEVDGDGDGIALCGSDCDDTDATVWPGATELCNELDDDCDTLLPPEETDQDGDGYVGCVDDCNDAVAAMHPGATELCNGIDDDCDGNLSSDEQDDDNDGLTECDGDCDDGDPSIYPRSDLWEAPTDGVDSNCDGLDGTSTSTAWAWTEGQNPFDNLGAAACFVPDVDQDGVLELAVGAPFANPNGPNSGQLWLFSGADFQPGLNPLSSAMTSMVGDVAGDEFGFTVSSGDFDGDGRSEVVTGAWLNDDYAQLAGKSYVFGGATLASGGDLTTADADWTVAGDIWWDRVGWSGAATGDVDGDGRPDVMVAGYEVNTTVVDAGQTAIFHSSTPPAPGDHLLSEGDVLINGTEAYEASGFWIASGGNIDGDALDEVLVGAYIADGEGELDAGRAYLFLGSQLQSPGSLDTSNAHVTFTGNVPEAWLGYFVQFVGDLDGDGLSEVALGWPRRPGGGVQRGAVALWWGSTLVAGGTFSASSADLLFEGAADYARLGHSVVSAGDVDGDNRGDLLIAEPSTNAWGGSGGRVHLFLGASLPANGVVNVADADVSFEGDAQGSGLGRFLCPGDDFDGDGLDDLVLGAQWHPGSSSLAGRAFVFLSPF